MSLGISRKMCQALKNHDLRLHLFSFLLRSLSDLCSRRAFPHLAVHDEVSDTASEVFVLELWVDIRQILIHSSELKHLRHIQMPESTSEEVMTL